ncbi:MAG: hypothetical protein Fur0020_12390 [Thermodesulfovibrionia bacterium]
MKGFILSEDGFTLMELLVTVVMTTIVIAAVFTTFITQQRSFGTQDQVAEMVQSSKIAFNILVDTIRNTGSGYPESEYPDINGHGVVIDAVDSGDNGGPDAVTLIGGFKRVATLSQSLAYGSNQMRISYIDEPEFNMADKRYISIDGIGYATITNCTLDDNGKCDSSQLITLDRAVNVSYPAGRPVYLVEDITFCVNDNRELQMRKRGANAATCTGGNEVETVLQNVDDLQFSYGVDTDKDNVIDRWVNTPPAGSIVNAVRVGIVTRTMREDQDLNPASKPYHTTGITLENNNTPDNDRFRRMVWQMTITVRNLRQV